jgi:predicted nucleotidyltransferase
MSNVPIQTDKLPEFCHRWQIRELSFFGSVVRPDFSSRSDVDVLVTFEKSSTWSLFELAQMQLELQEMFGREVDLLEEDAIRNPYLLASIRRTKQVQYAA